MPALGACSRLRNASAVAALAVQLLYGLTAPAAAQDAPGAASLRRYIAADVPMYLEMDRPADVLDRLSAPALRAIVDGAPGVKGLRQANGFAELNAALTLVAGRVGVERVELLRRLTAGGAAVAVDAGPDNKARLLVVIRPDDPALLEKATSALRDLVREDAENKGSDNPIESADYRGITGYQISKDLVYAIVDGVLIASSNGDGLKAAIDRVRESDEPSLAGSDPAKARAAEFAKDSLAWGFARLDRLRALDPDRWVVKETTDAGAQIFFGPWIETLRKADWIAGSIAWTNDRLGLRLAMPVASGGLDEAYAAYLPPKGEGAVALPAVPGPIGGVSAWRDLSALWDARAELLPPEALQGLAQLDGLAGTFFAANDFGTVLRNFGPDWRIVVAEQDHTKLNPVPTDKLPSFALIASLRDDQGLDSADFSRRLQVAFQSIVGLANLGAAQQKAPPLTLGSENFQGATLSTATYMPPPKDAEAAKADASSPVASRHNYSPTLALAGKRVVLSSTTDLARSLVAAFEAPQAAPKGDPVTLRIDASGPALAKLVDLNRERLVLQNMLQEGNDRPRAEGAVEALKTLLGYFEQGTLRVIDRPDRWEATADFALGGSKP